MGPFSGSNLTREILECTWLLQYSSQCNEVLSFWCITEDLHWKETQLFYRLFIVLIRRTQCLPASSPWAFDMKTIRSTHLRQQPIYYENIYFRKDFKSRITQKYQHSVKTTRFVGFNKNKLWLSSYLPKLDTDLQFQNTQDKNVKLLSEVIYKDILPFWPNASLPIPTHQNASRFY